MNRPNFSNGSEKGDKVNSVPRFSGKRLRQTPFLVFLAACFFLTELPMRTIQLSGLGAGIGFAEAQEKKKRSLFSILFGRKSARKKKVRKRTLRRKAGTRTKRRKTRRTSSTAQRTGAGAGPAAKVKKSESALKVLVIGDFLASRTARGLDDRFDGAAGIAIVNKASGSSGFVRSDIIDWPIALPKLIEENDAAMVVAILGTNDRQQMRVDGKRLATRSEEWDAAYQARVKALADAFKASGKPFVWLGLPPVRFSKMNVDLIQFNEWYQAAATEAGGKFIDVWDGFSDENGAYVRSGPDVNGQIVLLRGKDGVNLTAAGARRLAFYAEPEIKRTLGGAIDLQTVTIDPARTLPKAPQYDPAKTGRTFVINLGDPSSDGGDVLAGADVKLARSTAKATKTASTKATLPQEVKKPVRVAKKPPALRSDNYAWPRRAAVAAPDPATATASQ